jgi:hypothetical protein
MSRCTEDLAGEWHFHFCGVAFFEAAIFTAIILIGRLDQRDSLPQFSQ